MNSQRQTIQLFRSVRALRSPIVSRSIRAPVTVRAFSVSSPAGAKGDDSTIDFYKLPHANYVPTEVGPSVKIPVLPDNYAASVTETKVNKNHLTSEFNKPMISHVSAQDTASNMSDADILATTGAGGPYSGGSLPGNSDQLEKLSSKDQSVLLTIAALIVAWFVVGNAIESSSDKE